MDVEEPEPRTSDSESSPKRSSTAGQSTDMMSPPTSPETKKRSSSPPSPSVRTNARGRGASVDKDLDDLTSGLTSLSLVPPSIRFGRGGKAGALLGRGSKAAARTPAQGNDGSAAQTTAVLGSGKRPSRGRGVGHGFGVVGRSDGTETSENT